MGFTFNLNVDEMLILNQYLSQSNSTSALVGSDMIMGRTPKPLKTHYKLVMHFQSTKEADVQNATLF